MASITTNYDFTASYADVGTFDSAGYKLATIGLSITVNNSSGLKARFWYLTDEGTTYFPIYKKKKSIESENKYEFEEHEISLTSGTATIDVNIPDNAKTIKMQVKADTVGATAANITEAIAVLSRNSNGAGDEVQDNLPFYIDCAMSRRDDCSTIFKFGENPDLDVADGKADIWEFAPTVQNYVYQSSAGVHYISSSDNSDTQDIEVTGLDANWNEQTVTVTLVGQTKTQIGTGETFIRVHRARNVGSTDLAGVVYIYEDDTVVVGVPNTNSKVKAYIMNGNNQTLMTQISVPAGKTGLIKWVQSSLSKKKDGILGVTIFVRPFGQVFQIKESFNVMSSGSSLVHKDFDGIPIIATEKSDIVMRAEGSEDDMAVTGSMGIIFVDN